VMDGHHPVVFDSFENARHSVLDRIESITG